jgi:hypothetical protein
LESTFLAPEPQESSPEAKTPTFSSGFHWATTLGAAQLMRPHPDQIEAGSMEEVDLRRTSAPQEASVALNRAPTFSGSRIFLSDLFVFRE